MAYTLRTLVLIFMGIMIINTSHAKAQDNQARLQTLFENILEKQKYSLEKRDLVKFITDGELLVEPVDNYFAVTLPHIRLRYNNGQTLDLGIISINAAPHESDKKWKVSFALPPSFVMYNYQNQPITRTTIGKQKIAGIWDENLQSFAKLDATYSNIRIESSAPKLDIEIPTAEIKHDLALESEGLWSGSYLLLMKNIDLTMPEQNGSMQLDKVEARFGVDRYNPENTNSFKEAVFELSRLSQEEKTEKSGPLIDKAIKNLMASGNSFETNYVFSGFKLQGNDRLGNKISTKADNIEFGLDFLDLMQDKSSINIRARYNGLDMGGSVADYKGFNPSDMNIDLTLKDFPLSEIFNLGRTSLRTAIAQPDNAYISGLSFLFQIPTLLSSAQTKVIFKDNFVKNDDYKLTINGEVLSNMSAVFKAVGNAQAQFSGLDKMLAKTQVLIDDPDAKNKKSIRKIHDTLEKLKPIGRVETNEDNDFVHIFDLLLTEEGRLLINEVDYNKLKNQ